MATKYHRSQNSIDNDPKWLLLCAFLVVALAVVALPSIILGFVAQRTLSRYLHWRLSFAIWFVPVIPCLLLLFAGSGLQSTMVHTVLQYILAAKQHQYDFIHWPLGDLWAGTWSLWLQTFFIGIPLSGFWFEIMSNMRTDTVRQVLQGERSRQRRLARTQERARKRTRHASRVPDMVKSAMVMGVPIRDEEQE